MGAPATAVACGICHPGSSSYNASHRDGLIKVSSRINSSPLTTPYNNNTSAFPQNATPTPRSCASVNCHFETDTPVWGSATFTSATDCSKCHGAAPADGTHPKHAAYYGFPATTSSCTKCHIDHSGESSPFAHATSAGKRGLVVSFAAAPNNGFGRYTGNLSYPNYLPSQNQAIDKGTMKPVKNSVEARINRMTQKLALTAEQQAAIKSILENEAIRLKAIITDANQDNSEHKVKLQELREATSNKIRSVLTPEQQLQEEFRKELLERRKKKDIKQLR